MDEKEPQSPAPQTDTEAEKQKATSPTPEQRRRRQRSAFQYIAILFAAAFLLMLYSYLMERRQHELSQVENQEQISQLQQNSDSAAQRLEDIIGERDSLKEEAAALEEQVRNLEQELADTREQMTELQESFYDANRRRNAALDLFLLEEQMRLGEYEDAARTYKLLTDGDNYWLIFQASPNMIGAGVKAETRCIEIARQLIALDHLTEEEARIEYLDGSIPADGLPPV